MNDKQIEKITKKLKDGLPENFGILPKRIVPKLLNPNYAIETLEGEKRYGPILGSKELPMTEQELRKYKETGQV